MASYTTIQQLELELKKKDREIDRLTNSIEVLRNKVNNLTVESIELSNLKSVKFDKNAKSFQDIIEQQDKELKQLREELSNKDKYYEYLIRENNLKFEKELYTLRTSHENLVGKAENATAIERLSDRQHKQIEIYDDLLKAIQIDYRTQRSEMQIKHEIKFSELKKKMLEHIKDTQKNITQLNLENMDVSTKLILLQNHQLIIELEYQSQQVEELLKKKEMLEMKVYQLQHDIEIGETVQENLSLKNKTLLDLLKKQSEGDNALSRTGKSFFNNGQQQGSHLGTTNDLTSSFNVFERKAKMLEKQVHLKTTEFNALKFNFDVLQDKLLSYEKKYANIFNLFEIGIQKLCEDDEIRKNKDLYINLDYLKSCEFEIFNTEQKYSILMVLVKHILPLVNLQSEVKQTLNNVKVRYREPENAKLVENMKFIESLPQIKTSQNFYNFKKKFVL
jgi:hypothetical protein